MESSSGGGSVRLARCGSLRRRLKRRSRTCSTTAASPADAAATPAGGRGDAPGRRGVHGRGTTQGDRGRGHGDTSPSRCSARPSRTSPSTRAATTLGALRRAVGMFLASRGVAGASSTEAAVTPDSSSRRVFRSSRGSDAGGFDLALAGDRHAGADRNGGRCGSTPTTGSWGRGRRRRRPARDRGRGDRAGRAQGRHRGRDPGTPYGPARRRSTHTSATARSETLSRGARAAGARTVSPASSRIAFRSDALSGSFCRPSPSAMDRRYRGSTPPFLNLGGGPGWVHASVPGYAPSARHR